MEIQEHEQRRAKNQVWTAAEEYEFEPELKTYDAEGRADLYWNTVAGCVRRDWGGALEGLFASFEGLTDRRIYEQLAWLGLESAAFARERDGRPAMAALRQSYARKTLAAFERTPSDRLVHVLTAGRAATGRFLSRWTCRGSWTGRRFWSIWSRPLRSGSAMRPRTPPTPKIRRSCGP